MTSPPPAPGLAADHAPSAPGEVWSQAWPTVVAMTSYTVMQFVDALMIGQVGPLELAAQGNGGVWAFAPMSFAMGVLTVVNTFVAQQLGAKTPERGARYAWAGIWFAVAMWLVVLVPFALALPSFFESIGHAPELVRLESTYARILLFCGVIALAGKSLSHWFFGMHRPQVITVSAIAGNVVNLFATYALVFGEEGLPAWGLPGVPGLAPMGIAGAAIGTVIGTVVELLIPGAVFLGSNCARLYGTRSAWRFDRAALRDLLRIGWPAGAQFSNELICWAIFMSILVGQFGAAHMTAGWIVLRYMHLSFMPAVGLGTAATAIVGRWIGAGELDVARRRAHLCLIVAVGYTTVCGVLMLVFREEMVRFFVADDADESIVRIGSTLMLCAALFQSLDAVGIVYGGALRGAADTVWPGVVTIVLAWVLIVGLGWVLVTFAPQLESLGPWIGAAIYIGAIGSALAFRFESGAWRRRAMLAAGDRTGMLERNAAQVAPRGPAPPAAEPLLSGRDLIDG